MYYAVAQLRQLEAQHRDARPPLMERAGAAAAAFIASRFGQARPILILAGPGNNGGDALVCARHLKAKGYDVDVVLLGSAAPPPDAKAALAAWHAAGGQTLDRIPSKAYLLAVDGLFGIGLQRPLAGQAAQLVRAANALDCPILALDIPSGIEADSGALLGEAIRAGWTLSFIGRAKGLATGAACDHAGESLLDTLGLTIPFPGEGLVIDPVAIAASLVRRADTHKGHFGTVGVIGGSEGMQGAALLAGMAATYAGAGKVRIGALAHSAVHMLAQPELMSAAPQALLQEALSSLIIGPGLGQSPEALQYLESAIDTSCPLVVDADALNLLAVHPSLAQRVAARHAATVLTPHPSEAARLLGLSTQQVQAQRFDAARQLSQRFNAVVALKGAGTLVDDGVHCAVNRTGSAALANAGQGDVLSGLIGALLAQGLAPWEAAALGVCLHGAASDVLVRSTMAYVTPASDVARAVSKVLGLWVRQAASPT